MVERLRLTQVINPGSWDRVLHPGTRREPVSPSAYVFVSLCVSLMNKVFKIFHLFQRERERLSVQIRGGVEGKGENLKQTPS